MLADEAEKVRNLMQESESASLLGETSITGDVDGSRKELIKVQYAILDQLKVIGASISKCLINMII
jgi:hypothetical protein